ncbi:hypothetical protein EWM64_g9114 [Hericium alpestre]|uniref:Uncharacterized protein n=1 Tax=Hericium alpestre TaxID=135208 RepID=A0A4Y9ZN06_9AGAM|nr:hypothetical protein EWM64_g9114 [Hericium alpestre]
MGTHSRLVAAKPVRPTGGPGRKAGGGTVMTTLAGTSHIQSMQDAKSKKGTEDTKDKKGAKGAGATPQAGASPKK